MRNKSVTAKHPHCIITMAAQVTESDQIKQFKEFLGTYNKLTENCFMDCVKDFTTREVKPEETSCSESCLQKYLKMTQRISMRFQEYHIQQNEALAAKAGFMEQGPPHWSSRAEDAGTGTSVRSPLTSARSSDNWIVGNFGSLKDRHYRFDHNAGLP
ncbi:hypothetical protein QQF64_010808 [Cirrhinus molitorella]|uniref:Tim10-like domain-containing protein n=1 Tax=Cirrhinus molitorella TaxID=172907 RepID=A0ABR3M0T7_9TELE